MSKGFDYVALAALVSTLEEEEAKFAVADEAQKVAAAVTDEHRKRVAELQVRIDQTISKLRSSPVWGTPWHEVDKSNSWSQQEAARIDLLQHLQKAAQSGITPNCFRAQLNEFNTQLAQASSNGNQAAMVVASPKHQGGAVSPPPPPDGFMSWKGG